MPPVSYDEAKATYHGGPLAYCTEHEHTMGILSEQAVAQMLGLAWTLPDGPDPGYDMLMGDIRIDVKWTDPTDEKKTTLRCGRGDRKHSHLRYKFDKAGTTDLYILTVGSPDSIDMVGFATEDRILQAKAKGLGFAIEEDGLHRWMLCADLLLSPVLIFDIAARKWPERFTQYIEQEYPRSAWDPEYTGAQVDTPNAPLPTLHPHRAAR